MSQRDLSDNWVVTLCAKILKSTLVCLLLRKRLRHTLILKESFNECNEDDSYGAWSCMQEEGGQYYDYEDEEVAAVFGGIYLVNH